MRDRIDVREALRLWWVWRNWREVAARLVRPNGMKYTHDAVSRAVRRFDKARAA